MATLIQHSLQLQTPSKFCIWSCFLESKHLLRGYLEQFGALSCVPPSYNKLVDHQHHNYIKLYQLYPPNQHHQHEQIITNLPK